MKLLVPQIGTIKKQGEIFLGNASGWVCGLMDFGGEGLFEFLGILSSFAWVGQPFMVGSG